MGQCPTEVLEGDQGTDPLVASNGPEIENGAGESAGHQDDENKDEGEGAGHIGPRLRSKGKGRDGYKRFAFFIGRDLQSDMGYFSEGDLTKEQYERHNENAKQQDEWKKAAHARRRNTG